jgi:hypothetical protein
MFFFFAKPRRRAARRLKKLQPNKKELESELLWYEDAFLDSKPQPPPPAYIDLHHRACTPPDLHKPQPVLPDQKPLPNLCSDKIPDEETREDTASPSSIYPPERPKRRAKTPVRYIGQLERASIISSQSPVHYAPGVDIASADLMAAQYQAILVERFGSPCPSEVGWTIPTRRIRKVKGRSSLKRAAIEQQCRLEVWKEIDEEVEGLGRGGASGSEDEETLVGSDFVVSPSVESKFALELEKVDQMEGSVGMQICLDLLINELTSGLKVCPRENDGKKDGLQVLLLIEAYELLRERLRGKYGNEAQRDRKPLRDVEKLLDQWIDVLHSIHGDFETGKGLDIGPSVETLRQIF